jgi:enamine deaminase RidA (YjgF/YER057c/UK114 family)
MKPVTLPKLDVDALFAMQKANMDTVVKAQSVLLDAAQAAVKAQYGFFAEYMDQMQAMMTGKIDAEKKPEAYVADVKAAADKYVTVTQNQMDLGMKAQAEAMDLIAKRVQQNVDELQKIAA